MIMRAGLRKIKCDSRVIGRQELYNLLPSANRKKPLGAIKFDCEPFHLFLASGGTKNALLLLLLFWCNTSLPLVKKWCPETQQCSSSPSLCVFRRSLFPIPRRLNLVSDQWIWQQKVWIIVCVYKWIRPAGTYYATALDFQFIFQPVRWEPRRFNNWSLHRRCVCCAARRHRSHQIYTRKYIKHINNKVEKKTCFFLLKFVFITVTTN